MPVVLFTVQLADGTTKQCYSPSSVVRRYFVTGEEMPAAEFLARSSEALAAASERVRERFGFACSSAVTEMADIEQWMSGVPSHSMVRILNI